MSYTVAPNFNDLLKIEQPPYKEGHLKNKHSMNLIPLNYKKNGYDYHLNYRDDLVAIYRQLDEGKHIAYEVVEIIQAPAGEVFGKPLPAREVLPSTNQWGSKGFTVHTLEQAIQKKDELRERIKHNREQNAQASVATEADKS